MKLPLSILTLLLGIAGFFFGQENPIFRFPLLAMLFPIALFLLGKYSKNYKKAFLYCWLLGTLAHAANMYWLVFPGVNYAGFPLILCLFFPLGLAAIMSLYYGFFGFLVHFFVPKLPHYFSLGITLGLCWALLEFGRGTIATGFSWAPLSASIMPWSNFAQNLAVFGAYCFSGILACLSIWTILSILSFCKLQAKKDTNILVLLTLCCFFALWGHGTQLYTTNYSGTEHTAILIQGNIDQKVKWQSSLTRIFDIYANLSTSAIKNLDRTPTNNTAIPLIIWPETAIPTDITRHKEIAPSVLMLSEKLNAYLLVGAPQFTDRPDNSGYIVENTAFFFAPSGQPHGAYSKEHLVPFGEYVPDILNVPFLNFALQHVGAFTPGVNTTLLTYKNTVKLGTLICYEAIFPEIAQKQVSQGAQVLVNISNDAWYGNSSALPQHLELARMRSIEQGRWLLRATNTGTSAIVDDKGVIRTSAPNFETLSLTGTFETRSHTTIYQKYSTWYLAFLSMLLFLFYSVALRHSIKLKSYGN